MTERLPIFPLASVLYPGLILPLHIFEGRYLQMVRDLEAMPPEQRRFGVVAIKQGRGVGEDAAASISLHNIGCMAEIREIEVLADERLALVTVGGQRFRLGKLDHTLAYLQGEVEPLDEPPGETAGTRARTVARLFTSYRMALTGTAGELEFVDDPELVSYVVAAAMMLELSDKQALLEAADTSQRLRREEALLRRELAMLEMLPSLPAIDLPNAEVSPN